mmetsp:Transcript_93957/g.242795  ORF Transcript_93957/g.242795 Transcript_93957/m.242795 type:complete len:268 (-) Transcript_93957:21-824(-)
MHERQRARARVGREPVLRDAAHERNLRIATQAVPQQHRERRALLRAALLRERRAERGEARVWRQGVVQPVQIHDRELALSHDRLPRLYEEPLDAQRAQAVAPLAAALQGCLGRIAELLGRAQHHPLSAPAAVAAGLQRVGRHLKLPVLVDQQVPNTILPGRRGAELNERHLDPKHVAVFGALRDVLEEALRHAPQQLRGAALALAVRRSAATAVADERPVASARGALQDRRQLFTQVLGGGRRPEIRVAAALGAPLGHLQPQADAAA